VHQKEKVLEIMIICYMLDSCSSNKSTENTLLRVGNLFDSCMMAERMIVDGNAMSVVVD
jgi:hypothetical protein